jgi:hypothetical protein
VRARQATARRFPTVDEHLDGIRQALGVTWAQFGNLTIAQVQEADRRASWCATHRGLRDPSCDWCRHLERNDAWKENLLKAEAGQ